MVMKPGASTKYAGCAASDPEIQALPVGGTWYPTSPPSSGKLGGVILHFHGGAFVIGDGRKDDTGFAAKTFLENTTATHVFAPQYRLASNPHGRFPAALQDAITSLLYLTETLSIPANKVTISGDSAGANLCLSLLRYIADNPSAQLPRPVCAFLWSPWVEPSASLRAGYFDAARNASTDYLTDGFGAWGARSYSPSKDTGLTLNHQNIDFLANPFRTETPLFWSVGECEALCHDVVKAYEAFSAVQGNKTELQIEKGAVHDIILVGDKTGFEAEAKASVKRAERFFEGCI